MSIVPTMKRLKDNFKIHPSEVNIGGSLLTYDFEDLDEFYTEKAKQELRETPEVAEEALKILLDLLADEEDLFVPMEKEFLQKFLRRCKWYPDSALQLIKEHYNFKRKHSEYFNDYLPSKLRNFFVSGTYTPLPQRTAKGERVIVLQSKHWKPNELSLDKIYPGIFMLAAIFTSEFRTQVAGAHVIIDVGSVGFRHVIQFTPWLAKTIVDFLMTCDPIRLKGIHIVNNPYFFYMIFAIFKPFLNEKFKQRILIHGEDKESLLKHIDAKALPKQYGGEVDFPDKPVGEPFYKYLCTFDDFIKEMYRYGYVTEI